LWNGYLGREKVNYNIHEKKMTIITTMKMLLRRPHRLKRHYQILLGLLRGGMGFEMEVA